MQRQQRKDLRIMKRDVVNSYMEFYNKLIDDTIQSHNEKIYGDLNNFLQTTTMKLQIARAKVQDFNLGRLGNLSSNIQKEQASQVPTCLVITSSESASSIDTQFSAMIKELSKNDVKAIDIVLNNKKCATMKNAIELI